MRVSERFSGLRRIVARFVTVSLMTVVGMGVLLRLYGCRQRPDVGAVAATPTSIAAGHGGAQFTDIAQSAGIGYLWHPPGARPLTILGTIGNGCALLDYDNDGNLDVLLVGPQLALYRGDGKGHFTNVTHATGLDTPKGNFLGCAVADYDNDGYEDIYLTAYRGGMLLHNEAGRGTANGRVFRDVTASSGIRPQPWSTSASWVDVDRDGRLDLYICNYVDFGPHAMPQLCQGGQSAILTACGPRHYAPIKGVLYRNLGGGKFGEVTGAWGGGACHGKALGATAADYDGSGRLSIAVANDGVEGDLLHNLGRRFEEAGARSGTAVDADGGLHGGMGIDWGDYDNDGRLDLVVATFEHQVKCLYHNQGDGLFSEVAARVGLGIAPTPYIAFGTKFFDYDNDGWLDLIFANGHVQDNIDLIDKSTTYRQPTLLFHNDQGKGFIEVGAQAGAALQRKIVGRGLAVGDFDNDGRLDVLVVDSEGAPLLLHNETRPVGHWLLCRLQGIKSNRDGLGTRVTFTLPDGSKRLRNCATDGSYMSASDRRVHCGLGGSVSADISVRWPSGIVDTYRGVKADQIVTLVEGRSSLAQANR